MFIPLFRVRVYIRPNSDLLVVNRNEKTGYFDHLFDVFSEFDSVFIQ